MYLSILSSFWGTLYSRYRDAASKDSDSYFALGSFLAGALSADGSTTYHDLEKGAIPKKYVDYQQAEKWLLESAKNGHKCSKNLLASVYIKMGKYSEAQIWARMCMQEGHHMGSAAYQLGQIYRLGLGVASDWKEAARWYRKSAGEGNDAAKEALRQMGTNY